MSIKLEFIAFFFLVSLTSIVAAYANTIELDLTSHNFNNPKCGDEHKHYDVCVDDIVAIRGRPIDTKGELDWPRIEGSENVKKLSGDYRVQKFQCSNVGESSARYYCAHENDVPTGGSVYLTFTVHPAGSTLNNSVKSPPHTNRNREFLIDLRSHDFNNQKSTDEHRHYKLALDETVVIKGNPLQVNETLKFWPRLAGKGNADVLTDWEDHVQKLKPIVVGESKAEYWCETGVGPCGGIIYLKFDVLPSGTIVKTRQPTEHQIRWRAQKAAARTRIK